MRVIFKELNNQNKKKKNDLLKKKNDVNKNIKRTPFSS